MAPFRVNHVYLWVEIVPLRVPYYRQSNSAPRGDVSVPFFLSVEANREYVEGKRMMR